MKYKSIIILTSVLLLFAVLFLIRSIYTVKNTGNQLLMIRAITDWKSNRNNPVDGVVNIGQGLYAVLTSHNVPLDQLEVKSALCDCFGYTLSVTHSIVVISPRSSLCIRLRYDILLGKYHLVGYSGSIE
jgi:uncharacterized membrane protein YjdF